MFDNDRLLLRVLLFALLCARLWVLAPFWPALVWAAVLAFAGWPLMRMLTPLRGSRESLAAGVLTLGLIVLV
ncbi:AI-2E family transporter, partial [Pseudomonas aeruginosa]